jgi:hypothetical protein
MTLDYVNTSAATKHTSSGLSAMSLGTIPIGNDIDSLPPDDPPAVRANVDWQVQVQK